MVGGKKLLRAMTRPHRIGAVLLWAGLTALSAFLLSCEWRSNIAHACDLTQNCYRPTKQNLAEASTVGCSYNANLIFGLGGA
ncbi:hypothetical protein BVRB_028240 [Beta vulgaris subsp. vulgaris]|uniref:Uncharacterized protein n=1 Tax=Beta vulgaris subsp. vulgaris TaxID=3555 RepID=A0A0J8DSN4_BETVV|nr:hypothetical protein BVRB_028240 [Beta vulgaris subsp. vulgaris]